MGWLSWFPLPWNSTPDPNGAIGAPISSCRRRFGANFAGDVKYGPGKMRVIGHRGASHVAPENTLTALEKALPGGFEIDVTRLVDGTVVVLHDQTLERTGRGNPDLLSRPVHSLSYDDIRDVDVGSWKGPNFAGERVPTLENVMSILEQNPGAHCFVELKCGCHLDEYVFTDVGLPRAAADVVAAARIGKDQLTWISFSLPALLAVKQHSSFPTLLVAWPDSEAKAFEIAETAVRNGFDGIDLHADPAIVTPGLVDWMKEREKKVAVWVMKAPCGEDNAKVWNAMAAAGVATLTSNMPPEIQEWLGTTELQSFTDGHL
jgi:glycerophosphoryl diester phosphodiesterase